MYNQVWYNAAVHKGCDSKAATGLGCPVTRARKFCKLVLTNLE